MRYHIIEKEPCCASQQNWPAKLDLSIRGPLCPRNRTSDLRVNEYDLSIGFAKRLRGHGPQQGATLGADHLVWGGPRRNFHAADAATRTRVRAGGLLESLGERG